MDITYALESFMNLLTQATTYNVDLRGASKQNETKQIQKKKKPTKLKQFSINPRTASLKS